MSEQLDRIEQMLRALCAHLGVQGVEKQGNGSGPDLGSDDGRRYTGVVSRFEHGWGFIECEAMNRNFFVHYSDIEGTGLRSLDAGDAVTFEIAPGKDGRPKAVRVRRQSGQAAARTFKSQASPRVGHGYREHGMEVEDDPAVGESEAPAAETAVVPDSSGSNDK